MFTRIVRLNVLFLCAATVCSPDVLAQSPEKKGKKPEIATANDVFGLPPRFGQGKVEQYALWYEDGWWHLRASGPVDIKTHFSGSVTCNKGQVSTRPFGLDKAKKPGKADFVKVNGDGTGFQYSWTNFGKSDGIDFKSGAKDGTFTFKLLVGGGETKRVLIGEDNRIPAKTPFSFPAVPQP